MIYRSKRSQDTVSLEAPNDLFQQPMSYDFPKMNGCYNVFLCLVSGESVRWVMSAILLLRQIHTTHVNTYASLVLALPVRTTYSSLFSVVCPNWKNLFFVKLTFHSNINFYCELFIGNGKVLS